MWSGGRGLGALIVLAGLLACRQEPALEPERSVEVPAEGVVSASVERDREEILSLAVTGLLEQHHLVRHPLDDASSEAAYAGYLGQLDPARLFLLQSDIDALDGYRDTLDDGVHGGKLELAEAGFARLSAGAEAVESEVSSLLGSPLELEGGDRFDTDGRSRRWCGDAEARRSRVSAVLRYQVIKTLAWEEVSGELTEAGRPARQMAVQRELSAEWAGRLSRMRAQDHVARIEGLLNAIIGVYDPHSAYLPPRRQAAFQVELSGTLVGVGLELAESGAGVRVASIRAGSPAWQDGRIAVGDVVVSVTGADGAVIEVGAMSVDGVAALLEGEVGSAVSVVVRRRGGGTVEVRLTRAVIEHSEQFARAAVLGEGARSVGYLAIPRFYGVASTAAGSGAPERNSATDVEGLLGALGRTRAKGLVLDLRGNEGGLFEDAVRVAGFFVAKAPIVQARMGDGALRVLGDDDPAVLWSGPVVVLVDARTGSAAEVLAAGLQDLGRAVIVGTGTCGKGTVQQLVDLDAFITSTKIDAIRPLGLFKLTSQQYFRITGGSTQFRGVTPDIALPSPEGHLEQGERFLPHVLPWSSADAVPFEHWETGGWTVEGLRGRSAARVAKDPVLTRFVRQTAVRRAQAGRTERVLSLSAEVERLRGEEAELAAVWRGVTRTPWTVAAPVGVDPTRPPPPEGWSEELRGDAWLQEAAQVLADMGAKGR